MNTQLPLATVLDESIRTLFWKGYAYADIFCKGSKYADIIGLEKDGFIISVRALLKDIYSD